MKFDVIIGNPPYQDIVKRKKTPHKLWIDFTKKSFTHWLKSGGYLVQVSPNSFFSPSNKVLKILQEKHCSTLNLDTKKYFPGVGSSFAHYIIKNDSSIEETRIITNAQTFSMVIDSSVFYIPNDICEESLSIHKKVMFDYINKLNVKFDYTTCHNALLNKSNTLSKVKTEKHIYPVLHTNSQIWYSSIKQSWSSKKKVMWSRSGYTKPFYDDGVLGGTDMIYYVLVKSETVGNNLVHNLNTKLIKYILKTAKWSGFGNEKVFRSLPDLLSEKKLTDDEICNKFELTEKERMYVYEY